VLLETGPISRSELCKIATSKKMYFDESNAIRRIKSEVKQNILKENADGLIVLN